MNEPFDTWVQMKEQVKQLKEANMRLINRDVQTVKKISRCWDEIRQIKADIESNNRQIARLQETIDAWEASMKNASTNAGKL